MNHIPCPNYARSVRAALLATFIFTVLFAILSSDTLAQTTVDGAFKGLVKDAQTGTPIAGARILFRSKDTGQEVVSTTGSDGTFNREHLASGEYEIEITATGYDPSGTIVKPLYTGDWFNVDPVPFPLTKTAQVAVNPTPDQPLPPGQPSPVPRPTPAIAKQDEAGGEAERISLSIKRGGIFDRNLVSALPLGNRTYTRSFDELALLVPGVTLPPLTIGNGSGPGQGAGVGSAGQFSVNGMRSRSNNFTVDGSDNNDEDIGVRRQGFFTLVPQPIESIQEYQITTLLAPAQYGRNIGAQVNAVSRTGGNDFHGTVYGFLNSNRLNAASPFDFTGRSYSIPLSATLPSGEVRDVYLDDQRAFVSNDAGGKDGLDLLQGGFVLGGPIIRSDPYREAHNLYFFISGEGQRLNANKEISFAVPAVRQRGLFDSGAGGDCCFGSTGLPIYPTTLMGDAIFSLFPFPNDPNGIFGENTLTKLLPADARGWVASGKLDGSFKAFGRAQQLVARYNISDDRRQLPVTGGAIFSSLEPHVRTQNISVFSNTPKLTSHSSNQFRASFGRTNLTFREIRDPFLLASEQVPSAPFLLNARFITNETLPDPFNDGTVQYRTFRVLGFAQTTEHGFLPQAPGTGPLGRLEINGFSPLGVDVYNFPQRRTNNTYQLADTVSVIKGRTTLTFGADTRKTQLVSDLPSNSRPLAVFGGTAIQDDFVFRPNDFAAAGAATGFYTTFATGGADIDLRYNQIDLFGQADWRAKPNLLVSLGLRYEYNTVPAEHNHRIERTFDSPLLDLIPDLKTFIGGRKRIYEPDRNNFGPRVGVAYSHEGSGGRQTVLRAGYGLYFDQILGAVVSQSRNVFPTFLTLNSAGGPASIPPDTIRDLTLFNLAFSTPSYCIALNFGGFNDCYVVPGTLNTLNAPADLVVGFNSVARPGSFSLTLPERNLKTPFAHQYHFTVEQEVARNTFLSAAYVGTLGRNLLRITTPNLGPNLTVVPLSVAGDDFVPSIVGYVQSPGVPLNNPGATRPLPSAGAVTIYRSNGRSQYDSLQLQLRGRLWNRVNYLTNYTYAHSKDDVSDVFDLAGAYALPQNSCRDLVELTHTTNLPPDCNLAASEYAASNFDVRHRFSYYLDYTLPGVRSGGRFRRAIFGDAQFVTSGYYQSGQPFTVNSIIDVNYDGNLTDRLNSLDGLQLTGSHRQPIILDRNADLSRLRAPLGQDGIIPRNSFRAGNLLSLDLAVVKNFPIREDQRISFRMEIFNFINRANYGIPVRLLEAPGFGQATDTVTPGRRIQFALKYIF